MGVSGVVDVEVSFEEKSAVCTVAKDLDPQKLVSAVSGQFKAALK